MTDDTSPISSDEPAADVNISSPATGHSLAALSRRIAGRTTDMIVIAIVAAAVLSVGERVLSWSRRPETALHQTAQDLASPDTKSPIESFKTDQYLLKSLTVVSDHSSIKQQLTTVVHEELSNQPSPLSPTVSHAEQELLSRIEKLSPFAAGEGLRLYHVSSPVLTVIAVTQTSDSGSTSSPPNPQSGRIAGFGVALHVEDSRWRLLIIRPNPESPPDFAAGLTILSDGH